MSRNVLNLFGACALLASMASAAAAPVTVPNHSFEAPDVPEVAPFVDAWQKTPKPDWFQEVPPEQLWGNLVGVFKNTPSINSSHIPNMDGDQALYLFNVPQAGLYQDLDATFEPGKAYALTVGAFGGGGGMQPGATFMMSLYYRDAASNMVTVAAKQITHSTNLFPSAAWLVDVSLESAVVRATNDWAGKKIGIMIMTTSGQEHTGGYWDMDNVRLTKFEPIPVPNHSFESPDVPEVAPFVDAWQKTPKPDWFQEVPPEQLWDNLVGVFENTPSTNADHIANIDGSQALYLFNVPQAGLFQELNATYEPGKSYTLTAGVLAAGGGMPSGAAMLASLYFMDGTNMVTVASAPVVYSTNQFPARTFFVDVSVKSSAVQASDAWAGKKIGIMFMTISGQQMVGGYWDLDNVRLYADQAETGPALTIKHSGGTVQVSWPTENGKSYQLQSSEDLRSWSNQGDAHSGTGQPYGVLALVNGARFYRVLVQ